MSFIKTEFKFYNGTHLSRNNKGNIIFLIPGTVYSTSKSITHPGNCVNSGQVPNQI